jgi:hypothetical protein
MALREELWPWDSQPSGDLRANWDHPAAAGLIGVWIAGNGTNLVSRFVAPAPSATLSSIGGLASRFVGVIETDTAKNRPAFAFATALVTGTPGAQSRVLGRGSSSVEFGFHATHGTGGYSGAVYCGSSFSIIGKPTGGALAANTRYVVGAGASGGAGAVYLNGAKTASVASGLSTIGTAGTYEWGKDGSYELWTVPPGLEYLYIWNRWPPDAVFAEVAARPYDLVEPRRIWVPVSAGGSYTLTAGSGSYTLTGQAAGLLAGRTLAAAQGSYALTGQDAALLKGNTLAAAQGSYTLTGQDVALLRGLLLSAAQGSYALTGQDATLTYTPLGAFSLTADQGSYALTGQSASLLWGPVLAAGQGSYTLNGQDATLTYTPVGAYILTAGQGSYALTGQDVLLQWGHVLAAAQGSYTLTGQAATLSRGIVLAAAQGSYTLTGQAAVFARTYVMSAGYGSYALTGQIVSLTYSGAALEALEYLLLISHITQSMSKTSKVTMEVDLISRIQQQLDGSSSI